MKGIVLSKKFKQAYKKRIKGKRKAELEYKKAIRLFIINPEHPRLRNHFLKVKKKDLSVYRAFSVADDLRVIFKEEKECYYFVDIGTHKQVYG